MGFLQAVINLIQQTTDEASCNTLKAQIEQENKALNALELELKAIAFSGKDIRSKSQELGTCSVTGYACPTYTKEGQELEMCYSEEENNGGDQTPGGYTE